MEKQEQKLIRNQHCVNCVHVFKCKGSVDPKMCVNYEERKEEKSKLYKLYKD